jgi:hypothetical protein
MTEQEKELMTNFKIEELEERLEMKKHWGANCGGTASTCGDPGSHPK